ncbi:MAG: inositol monophosphatase [Candidatus Omnitrophica bacterium]|nr:inositol monophosphatase [Candidatus Omnitrophota bacterium]
MNKIKEVAENVAKEAGEYVLKHMGRLKEVSHKSGINDLVTDVDKGSEKIIISRIKNEFPEHSILAEESGEEDAGSVFRWVIDPLDGTTNYTHSFPFFCVSIGVLYGKKVIAGVVYDPSRDELFTAIDGSGAFLNGMPIKVSGAQAVKDSLIATGFAYNIQTKKENVSYFGRMLQHAQAVRRAGSAALDLCYVACGIFDGFWEMGLHPWDTAAGQLMVTEAGGKVTNMSGEMFDIFQNSVVATNASIHSEVIELLK